MLQPILKALLIIKKIAIYYETIIEDEDPQLKAFCCFVGFNRNNL